MKIINLLFSLTLFFGCGGSKAGYEGNGETSALIRGNDLSANKEVIANANVRFEPGVVYLKSTGFGKRQEDAVEQAKMNAVDAILFKGVPGSSVASPIVDREASQKHQSFFKKFMEPGGEYVRYIINSNYDPAERVSVKGGVRIGLELEINYAQLQKRLEDADIIKPFGIK
jgi:hypothetical protein